MLAGHELNDSLSNVSRTIQRCVYVVYAMHHECTHHAKKQTWYYQNGQKVKMVKFEEMGCSRLCLRSTTTSSA